MNEYIYGRGVVYSRGVKERYEVCYSIAECKS